MIKLDTRTDVNINNNNNLRKEIEEFLLSSASLLNPLFSSPLFVIQEKKDNFIDYKYFIVRDENKIIIALHLILYSYKGHSFLSLKANFIRKILSPFLKYLFPRVSWRNQIFFANIDTNIKLKIKNLIYNKLNESNIVFSPIYEDDDSYFKNVNYKTWGTYIIGFIDITYEEMFKSLKRQVKRPIKKCISDGVEVSIINNVDELLLWKKDVINTGMRLSPHLESWYIEFKKYDNYHFDIFVAYKNDIFLGSLIVYGFGNYISEITSITSAYARKYKLYVQDYIKDRIFKYAIDKEILYYDLAGFNPNDDASDKEKSIKNFKKKFNGSEILYQYIESK